MTCIIGMVENQKVYIGADSRGADGLSYYDRNDKKVFIKHKIAYGFTSSYRMGQILQYHTEHIKGDRTHDTFGYVVELLIPHYRSILSKNGYTQINNNKEMGGCFIIGLEGKIFTIQSDFQVSENSINYASVGCGAEYALGALHILHNLKFKPRIKIKKALLTAMAFSAGVGGDINIVHV